MPDTSQVVFLLWAIVLLWSQLSKGQAKLDPIHHRPASWRREPKGGSTARVNHDRLLESFDGVIIAGCSSNLLKNLEDCQGLNELAIGSLGFMFAGRLCAANVYLHCFAEHRFRAYITCSVHTRHSPIVTSTSQPPSTSVSFKWYRRCTDSKSIRFSYQNRCRRLSWFMTSPLCERPSRKRSLSVLELIHSPITRDSFSSVAFPIHPTDFIAPFKKIIAPLGVSI